MSESQQKPLQGPFDSIQECTNEMMEEQGYDQETARATCVTIMEPGKEPPTNEDKSFIYDLDIPIVSIVDNPAVQDSETLEIKEITKSKDTENRKTFRKSGPPVRLDPDQFRDTDNLKKQFDFGFQEEKRHFYAPVLVPGKFDLQGDITNKAEIYETAVKYFQEYRQIDSDHDLETGKADPIQSMTLPKAMTLETIDMEEKEFPQGTWILGSEIKDDEVWEEIQAGEKQGYSIYGDGRSIPLNKTIRELKNKKQPEKNNKELLEMVESMEEEKFNEKLEEKVSEVIDNRESSEEEPEDMVQVKNDSLRKFIGSVQKMEKEEGEVDYEKQDIENIVAGIKELKDLLPDLMSMLSTGQDKEETEPEPEEDKEPEESEDTDKQDLEEIAELLSDKLEIPMDEVLQGLESLGWTGEEEDQESEETEEQETEDKEPEESEEDKEETDQEKSGNPFRKGSSTHGYKQDKEQEKQGKDFNKVVEENKDELEKEKQNKYKKESDE